MGARVNGWGVASCQKRVELEQGCVFVTFSGKPHGTDSIMPEQLGKKELFQ